MKENPRDDYRNSKPTISINSILELETENPNMIYTAVRMDDRLDLTKEFLDNGWAIAYETSKVTNDYDSEKSRTKDSTSKPSPIYRAGRGGAQFIYMCKSKEQQKADQKRRVDEDQKRLEASGSRITKKGHNTNITGSEISINK